MREPIKLTKSFIDKITPTDKDTVYWDTEIKGFGLKVTPKGRKVYIIQHRPKGHKGAAKKYTIGKYGNLKHYKARERAHEVMLDSTKGIDRGANERANSLKKSSDIVSSLVEEFLTKHSTHNRTHDETRRIFFSDVVPLIGNQSIHTVTKADIIAIIERVADRGALVMANRTLAAVRKFLNWCVSRGVIEISPANGITAQTREISRDRVLTDDETMAIYKAAKTTGYPFGTIVQLLFLTAQRRNEVAHMRWSEVNFPNFVWTLPASRSKNGKAHDVHMSQTTVELMKSIPHFAAPDDNASDLIFTTTGLTPVSGFSKAKANLDKLSGVTDWRLHDIRRTVVTGMSKMGVAIHVADAILNHKSSAISSVAAIYQRNEFIDERREALDQWSDKLVELVN